MEENQAKNQEKDPWAKWTETREDGRTVEALWLGKDGGSEKYWLGKEESILAMCKGIEWREVMTVGLPDSRVKMLVLPALEGMAVLEAINGYRIPRVSHVGWSNALAPIGIIAIRGHYVKNGKTADLFFLDEGDILCPLLSIVVDMTEEELKTKTMERHQIVSSAIMAPEGGRA